MKFRTLGNTGLEVSAVSFGTWTIGGADWGRVDDRDSIKAVHRAVDLQINLFDTAPIYGNGRAETVLGLALEGIRQNVLIATKCGPWEDEQGRLRLDLSPAGIVAQCDASLKRLRTDWIDLMQVHWNDPAFPVGETMNALNKLKNAGKIRAYGVSNFSPDELTDAVSGGCSTLQSAYNLINRDVENRLLSICAESGIGFLAYEPLCRGLLAGRINSSTRFEPGDIRLGDPRFKGRAFADNLARVERLRRVSAAFGMEPASAAVAWVLYNTTVSTAICGIRTATHAVANAKAADIELDKDTAARLRAIFDD